MRNILVTGGAGYIGSQTCKKLFNKGYKPIVYDNLSRGNRWSVKWSPLVVGDTNDEKKLKNVIEKYRPDAVVHFAAYAYIGESTLYPGKYYKNNVSGTFSLLNAIIESGIKYFVFSSSCSTYGIPNKVPIPEDHIQQPISPYGYSKLIIERSLHDYNRAYGINSVSLRYFNAAGADSEGDIGEHHYPETHIIPLLFDVAVGKRKSFEIFGSDYPTKDGTCIRDYIHVEDIASAHVQSLKFFETNNGCHYFNLGTGKGYSVLEIIKKVEEVTGMSISFNIIDPRAGDAPTLVAEAKTVKNMNWIPKRSNINQIIEDAWKWYKKPNAR